MGKPQSQVHAMGFRETAGRDFRALRRMSSMACPQGSGDRRQRDSKSWEVMEDFKETSLPDSTGLTSMSSQTVAACTGLHGSKPDQAPVLRGGCGHGLPALTKKLSTTDVCWKRKSHLFQWSLTGSISHIPGQVHTQWIDNQHRITHWCF